MVLFKCGTRNQLPHIIPSLFLSHYLLHYEASHSVYIFPRISDSKDQLVRLIAYLLQLPTMRFSLVALAGLAAFGNNLGAQARATPTDVSLSSSVYTRGVTAFQEDNLKRRLASLLPRSPAVIRLKPVINTPDAPPPRFTGDTTPGSPKPPPGRDGPNTPAKPEPLTPVPVRNGADGPICIAPMRRSRIFGRTTYTKADANDASKVLQFMNEHRAYYEEVNIKQDKLVFFASGSDGLGRTMAHNFVRANVDGGYAHFDDLFKNSRYNKAFNGAWPGDGPPAEAASKAMALWARNPIVFNSGKGKSSTVRFSCLIVLQQPHKVFGYNMSYPTCTMLEALLK